MLTKCMKSLLRSALSFNPLLSRPFVVFFISIYLLINIGIPFEALASENDDVSSNNQRYEIVSRRTENTKTFHVGKDEFGREILELEATLGRVHYKTANGYQNINENFIKGNFGVYDYRTAASDYMVYASSNVENGVRIDYRGSAIVLKLIAKDLNKNAKLSVAGGKVTFKNVFYGSDWEITVTKDEIRNEIVLQNRKAARSEFRFEAIGLEGTKVRETNGKIVVMKNGSLVWESVPAIAYDAKYSSSKVEIEKGKPNEVLIKPNKNWLDNASYPVRVDPSFTRTPAKDALVRRYVPNANYGSWRFVSVGDFYDAVTGVDMGETESYIKFNLGGTSFGSNSIVLQADLSLYQYAYYVGGWNGQFTAHIARAKGSWSELGLTWNNKPGKTGDYASKVITVHNDPWGNNKKQVKFNVKNLVQYWATNTNRGLVVYPTGYSNNDGAAFCSKNTDGYCKSADRPKLYVKYVNNQAPNPPNVDFPNSLWELGANEGYGNVVCDTTGLGAGCDVNFRYQPQDPDNSFPLSTFVNIKSTEGGNSDFTDVKNNENWQVKIRHLNDGHWSWRAQTTDKYGATGSWSVTKSFIVDTTAPSQPNMISEPGFSPGLQNSISSTVSTDNIIGSVRYNFEVSEKSNFSTIKESSGWVAANSFTFANLEDNKQYYYRVRSRDKLENTNTWGTTTSSVQDATFPVQNNITLSPQIISPENQDGNHDSANLSFDVDELNWASNTVQILDASDTVVRTYSGLSQNVSLSIDGKDELGDWLADGFYKIKITSKDLAGNTTTNDFSSLILAIDNLSLYLNINHPSDGAWFNTSSLTTTGQAEADGFLDIIHPYFGSVHANIDSSGVFNALVGLQEGDNNFQYHGWDSVGNVTDLYRTYYREGKAPTFNAITPDSLIADRLSTIKLELEDLGYNDGTDDFISGIDETKTYLSLFDSTGSEIVLVNDGTNVSSLGHIEHDCSGSGNFGLSSVASCTYSYVLDSELQPDGVFEIYSKVYDVAGNEAISDRAVSFELDSHTYLDVLSPSDGTLLNYSLVTLSGEAEWNSTLDVTGAVDSQSFLVDPSLTSGRVTVDNCRASSDPDNDGIKQICDWEIMDFQLDRDTLNPGEVVNPVEYKLTDEAGNIQIINHTYKVDLYAVNLTIDTDIEYFSPNGDGRQDGVEFIDMFTDGLVDVWEIRIKDSGGNLVRTLDGVSSLPGNVFWDGTSTNSVWVDDGDYTYILYMKSTDGVEFETSPQNLYARTVLDDEVIITYPKNDWVTTKGVANVQGQAPASSARGINKVRICVDTIGLSANCDFEYYSEIDEYGSFSVLVPLVRLDGQIQTEHYLSAVAFDKYGNETPKSNIVRVVVDTLDPFVSVSAIPALSGVNDSDSYQDLIDKLNAGEEVTKADIDALRTVIFRSTVTQNTQRVKLSFKEFTDLSELPDNYDYDYLGYTDDEYESLYTSGADVSKFFESYEDGVTPIVSCSQTECTWDFYYPAATVGGGIYEVEFNGKKGETIQNVYASVTFDGTIPLAPIILDVNKIVGSESQNTNLFQDKYYSNSEVVEIIGGADPSTDISVKDQSGNIICQTTTNSIGLFSCTADISIFYPDVDVNNVELILTIEASDGIYTQQSLDTTTVVIDKVGPTITDISTYNQWRKSGDLTDLSVKTDEELAFGYFLTPENVQYDLGLYSDLKGGLKAFLVHGLAPEGKYQVDIEVGDLAYNKTSGTFEYFIDNTKPESVDIYTNSSPNQSNDADWGEFSGIQAFESIPASGRLVPEYVIRGNQLHIYTRAEKYSYVKVYVDNKEEDIIQVTSDSCERRHEDKVTDDGVVVKYGLYCDWEYIYTFPSEKGYLFALKAVDRAGNEALIGEDEIVYYDKTKPVKPQVWNAFSPSYNSIQTWKENGAKTGNYYPITKDTEVTLEGYGESLSDYEYWQAGPDGRQNEYKFFQNTGRGDHQKTFSLGTSKDTGDCIKMINGRRTGVCQDGLYSFKARSTDAAGNASSTLSLKIERDTVAPGKPSVNISKRGDILGEYMRISIIGERNTKANILISSSVGTSRNVWVNLGGDGYYFSNNLVGKLVCGDVKYTVTVKLTDRALNTGDPSYPDTVRTEDCPKCGYSEGTFAKPIHSNKAYIGYHYGYTQKYFNRTKFHTGVDYNGVNKGAAIYPAGIGTVKEVKFNVTCEGCEEEGYGNFVKIDHGNGLSSIYAHLMHEEVKPVKVGQSVTPSMSIGRMGSTGFSTGAHLHFGVNKNGSHVDPEIYLGEQNTNLTPEQFGKFCDLDLDTGQEYEDDVDFSVIADEEVDIIDPLMWEILDQAAYESMIRDLQEIQNNWWDPVAYVKLYGHYLYGILKGAIDSVADTIELIWNLITDFKDTFNELFESIKAIFNDPKIILYGLFDQLVQFFEKDIYKKAQAIGEIIGAFVPDILLTFLAGSGLAKTVTTAITKVKDGITGIKIVAKIATFANKVKTIIVGAVKMIIKFTKDALVKIKEFLKAIIDFILDKFEELIRKVEKALSKNQINYLRYKKYVKKLKYIFERSSNYRKKLIEALGLDDLPLNHQADHRIPVGYAKKNPKGVKEFMDMHGLKDINDPRILQSIDGKINNSQLRKAWNQVPTDASGVDLDVFLKNLDNSDPMFIGIRPDDAI